MINLNFKNSRFYKIYSTLANSNRHHLEKSPTLMESN